MLSDSESSDSDSGVRFKTTSTRGTVESSRPRNHDDSSRPRHTEDRSKRNTAYDDRDRRQRYDRRSPLNDRRRRSPSRDRSSRPYAGSSSHDRRRSRSRDRPHRSIRDQEMVQDKPKVEDTKTSRDKERHQDKGKSSKEEIVEKNRSSTNAETTPKTQKERSKNPSQEKRVNISHDESKPEKDERSSVEKSKKSKKTKRNKSKEREPKPHKDHDRSNSSRDSKSKSQQRDLQTNSQKQESSAELLKPIESSGSVCGPMLPPHLTKPSTSDDRPPSPKQIPTELVLGPSLPPTLLKPRPDRNDHSVSTSTSNGSRPIQGPCVPSPSVLLQHQHQDVMSDISEDEECPFGPVPVGVASQSEAHLELEKRALELKLAKFGTMDNMDDLVVRDEWMLELPEVKGVTDMGLTARQFRTKERPDMSNRSGWTETPNDRKSSRPKAPTEDELRAERQKEAKASFNENRDRVQEDEARKHKKKHKRDESLMDLHQKKLQQDKKKKKDEEKQSRRPFSRESDLKVNRFDQAQKNAILKKAQLLDTRFGRGETKYL